MKDRNEIVLDDSILEAGYVRICLPDNVILYVEFDNETGALEYLETQRNGWGFKTKDNRWVCVDFNEREILKI